jgi:hypothetical protein
MKCQFEHVTFAKGCSIRIYRRQIPSIPFEWHHHPVCELTLTLNSSGWRFVGDHIGQYGPQDLVLVPSDMPHTWASTAAIDESLPHTAPVVWFTKEWALRLADSCPELSRLRKLITRVNAGLSFSTSAGLRMESCLPDLLSHSPLKQLHTVQELLCELADVKATALATQIATSPKSADESDNWCESWTCFTSALQGRFGSRISPGGEHLGAIAPSVIYASPWRKRQRVLRGIADWAGLYASGGNGLPDQHGRG